eukprot:TRINITY_DN25115_c0_g1_i2.p1 TRINITY_DN25115_c0_g1~~TRINITY_DN25115_c0_g1_i2.p1  ORF type:complete len:949 (+),score=285.82 TRINITY_DN25115_c0_g1_i2:35-2848(+)
MGIQGFYPWLVNRYPRIVTTRPEAPENIYIDVNGLIHTCCMVDGSYQDDEAASIQRVVALVEELVRDMAPTKLVYLAVDGVAPKAKSNQQRCRRTTSSCNRVAALQRDGNPVDMVVKGMWVRTPDGWGCVAELQGGKVVLTNGKTYLRQEIVVGAADRPVDMWDSNAISVATEFMDKTCEKLKEWCQEQSGKPDVPYSIVFSGVRTPGEGEHKFIDFIRRERDLTSSFYTPNDKHVLVSGDTDLILLALSLHEPGVVVMRENRDGNGGFEYSSAAILREYLCEELIGKIRKCQEIIIKNRRKSRMRSAMAATTIFIIGAVKAFKLNPRTALVVWGLAMLSIWKFFHNKQYPMGDIDAERLIDDWLLSVVFVGNDFMPHLPAIYAGQHGMSTVVDSYVRAVVRLWARTGEVQYLMNPDASLNPLAWSSFMHYVATAESATMRSKQKLKSDDPWTATYYNSIHSITGSQLTVAEMREDMTQAYVEGLAWMGMYYLTPTIASWAWAYRHYQAPTARDIKNYFDLKVQANVKTVFLKDGSRPVRPLQQLMAVLPPASFSLLPEKVLARALEHGEEVYPVSWVVDMTGGVSVPIIPFAPEMSPGVAEPPDEAETLILPAAIELPPLAGGLTSSTDHPKVFQHYPHTISRQSPSLTRGTTLPAISAIRRTAYIPWRTAEEENRSVGGGKRYVLSLVFEKKVPFVGFLCSVVKRSFGVPCNKPYTNGNTVEVTVAEYDAEKVAKLVPAGGTMTIDKQRVDVAFAEDSEKMKMETFVIKDLPREVRFNQVAEFCESEWGVTVGHIRMKDGDALVPYDGAKKDIVEAAIKANPWRTIVSSVKLELPPRKIDIHPRDIALENFFTEPSISSYSDWACEKCLTRCYAREDKCISCRAQRMPGYLPLTFRRGGESNSHYEADHSLQILKENQRNTAVPAPSNGKTSPSA